MQSCETNAPALELFLIRLISLYSRSATSNTEYFYPIIYFQDTLKMLCKFTINLLKLIKQLICLTKIDDIQLKQFDYIG